MLAYPPAILRLLQMCALIKNYQHGRTRIGDRPGKIARRSEELNCWKRLCFKRPWVRSWFRWAAKWGGLEGGRRWQCEPRVWCSHSCVTRHRGTFTPTKVLAMKCSKWIKCQEYSIKWFSRSGLSSISHEQIREVAKCCISKQIWTKCSYHFEVKRANCRKEDFSSWNNAARLKAYSTELGR